MTDKTQPGADNALDLDAIEAAARGVPDHIRQQGWFVGPPSFGQQYVYAGNAEGNGKQHIASLPRDKGYFGTLAEFIAAANPQSVLALIALARRAAQPVETAVQEALTELRAEVRELQNHLETFGPSEEAARIAIDGVLDLIDEFSAEKAASHPSEPAVPAVGGALVAKRITCPSCKGAHAGMGRDGVEYDCPKCEDGMVTVPAGALVANAEPIVPQQGDIITFSATVRRGDKVHPVLRTEVEATGSAAAPADLATIDKAMWSLQEFYQHDATALQVIGECRALLASNQPISTGEKE
jgi:hypothetical protein